MNVMVIEKDSFVAEEIRQVFNYSIPEASVFTFNALKRPARIVKQQPDLVILSVEKMDDPGFDFIRQLRSLSEVPIITLSYSSECEILVKALNLGSNCHVKKPLRLMEFGARARSIIRRFGNHYTCEGSRGSQAAARDINT